MLVKSVITITLYYNNAQSAEQCNELANNFISYGIDRGSLTDDNSEIELTLMQSKVVESKKITAEEFGR